MTSQFDAGICTFKVDNAVAAADFGDLTLDNLKMPPNTSVAVLYDQGDPVVSTTSVRALAAKYFRARRDSVQVALPRVDVAVAEACFRFVLLKWLCCSHACLTSHSTQCYPSGTILVLTDGGPTNFTATASITLQMTSRFNKMQL